MTDNLPTNQETGDLFFTKRKMEQIESKVSKAKLFKKRKGVE